MSTEQKPQRTFEHQSLQWNETIPNASVNYVHLDQANSERKPSEQKVFSSDMNRHNDKPSQAPLQNCPNIVDHVAFSKSNSSSR